MKTRAISRILAMILVVIMAVSVLPINAFAAAVDYDMSTGDNYYKLISKKDWELAPGIQESEIILNNAEGSLRQVTHAVQIDLNNPYTKVVAGYKEMNPAVGSFGTQSTSVHAAWAEANGYGNVVAATNCSLSWYNSAYYTQNPQYIGEPLGYVVLDGKLQYVNSQGQSGGAVCCIVINSNEREIDGVITPRPADIPRVTIRSTKDAITGWEEQVIPVNFTFLVKDTDGDGVGENQYLNKKIEESGNFEDYHKSGFESRTFVGAKADGTLVVAVSDGRQAPYSTGFNSYEMAEYMLSMGCVVAANCDGGGSTTYMSERPGEDLKVNCSLSDGGERPTTNSILIISTAPENGEFARATISAEYDYYTPGSTVAFDALATDALGNEVDMPDDVTWAIKEEGMGTIENGVFVSNGTAGTVTAQMLRGGNVVGEHTITLAVPDSLSFYQPVLTIPYGERAKIPVRASINGGLHEIGISPDDVTVTIDNDQLGVIDGLHFIGNETAPENNLGKVTVTLKENPEVTAEVNLKLGDASVVMWDFEDGTLGGWKSIVQRELNQDHRDFVHDISIATKEDGEVHDGEYSLRLETNGLSSKAVHSQQYAYVRLGLPDEVNYIENARGLGFWLYVPEDNIQCWVQGYYRYDTDGDGTFDTMAEVNLMNSENVYYNVDESGWHYMYMDLSKQEKVQLGGPWNPDPANPKGTPADFFIAIIFHKSINNQLWQTNGSINGPFTYYIDNITVDYSEVVQDREEPVFGSITMDNNGTKVDLKKHSVGTTKSNLLNISANVAEATERVAATGEKTPLTNYTGIDPSSAKVYVDGRKVASTYENGQLSISDIAVADGYHRVKFEICDKAGNKAVKIRVVKVESGVKAPLAELVPEDPSLDRLLGGSIYWMNLVVTDMTAVTSVSMKVDLNSVNHWELEHMEVPYNYVAEWTVDEETNTATITISHKALSNELTGRVVLARIPIRIVSFDNDMQIPGYTAETFWKTYNMWPHDLKVDVLYGFVDYTQGINPGVAPTFSNEKFQVDTEIYTDSQSMDITYRAEKGTAHVHTAEAIEDKAATCEYGYTDRTFCKVCNSVVDWGTTLPAISGHTYEVVDGKLTCTVGGELFSGVKDGRTYVDGVIANGWTADNKSYYDDGVLLKGVHLIDGVVHTFDDNGIYQENVEHYGFVETDNGLMFFQNNTDYHTGYAYEGSKSYYFDENGIAREGEYVIGGEKVTFKGGQFVSAESSDVVMAGWAGPEMHFVFYKNGDFYLSGSGKMYFPKTGAYIPWYTVKNDIKNVYVGKDVEELGRFAFRLCFNIKSINFAEGNCLEKLDLYSLYYLIQIKSFKVPDNVTSIGTAAFGYMNNLTYVWLPEGVTSIHANAFMKLDPSKITLAVAEGTYAHNFAVKNGFKVELREKKPVATDSGTCGDNATWTLYNGEKLVISGSGAMDNYANRDEQPWAKYRNQITKIEIGKDITHIGKYAFTYSYNVRSVTFEEGSKLQSIDSFAIFYMYRYLTELELPETVKTIYGQAIGYNSALVDVYMPQGVSFVAPMAFLKSDKIVLNVAEGTYAEDFAVNNNIAYTTREYVYSAVASGTCGESATWTFYEDGRLVVSGSGAMADYANRDAQPWAAYREQITDIVIGKDITHLGKYAFAYSYNVRSVTFEEGSKLQSINSFAIYYMYRYLTELELPETVRTIAGQAIGYNSKLVDVYMPQGVSFVAANAFLKSDKIVLNVAEGTYAEDFAVNNKIAYTTREYVKMPIAEGTCGENATWEFYADGKLVIGGSGKMDDYANRDAQPWAIFREQITDIVIGKDITHLGKYAFAYSYNVRSVTFEEGSNLQSINSFAIYYMYRYLTELELPETVKTIYGQAIGYNSVLVDVYMPQGVSTVAANAFLKSGKVVLHVAEGSYAETFAKENNIAYVVE